MTDQLHSYRGLAQHFAGHEVVKHSEGEYVCGDAHTGAFGRRQSLRETFARSRSQSLVKWAFTGTRCPTGISWTGSRRRSSSEGGEGDAVAGAGKPPLLRRQPRRASM